MTDLRTAAQQALEALMDAQRHNYALKHKETDDLITALRAALVEPQSTHSAECFKWHHKCAVAEVERLRAALAQQPEPVQEPVQEPGQDLIPPESLFVCGQMGAHVTRVRLAEPVQEPVAWKDKTYESLHHQDFGNSIPLYTAPPQRKPLTTEEVELLWFRCNWTGKPNVGFAREIEKAHGIV